VAKQHSSITVIGRLQRVQWQLFMIIRVVIFDVRFFQEETQEIRYQWVMNKPIQETMTLLST